MLHFRVRIQQQSACFNTWLEPNDSNSEWTYLNSMQVYHCSTIASTGVCLCVHVIYFHCPFFPHLVAKKTNSTKNVVSRNMSSDLFMDEWGLCYYIQTFKKTSSQPHEESFWVWIVTICHRRQTALRTLLCHYHLCIHIIHIGACTCMSVLLSAVRDGWLIRFKMMMTMMIYNSARMLCTDREQAHCSEGALSLINGGLGWMLQRKQKDSSLLNCSS